MVLHSLNNSLRQFPQEIMKNNVDILKKNWQCHFKRARTGHLNDYLCKALGRLIFPNEAGPNRILVG